MHQQSVSGYGVLSEGILEKSLLREGKESGCNRREHIIKECIRGGRIERVYREGILGEVV